MANMFGSWKSLVSIIFKKDGQALRLKPKVGTTVTGAVEFELPSLAVGSEVLVAEGTAQTLTQKTLSSPTLSGNVAGSPTFTGTPALTLSDTSNALLKGGNTTGAALSLGTNDNFAVQIEANGEVQFSVLPASAANADVVVNGVGALMLPVGTTAQRPTTAVNGMIRKNSDLSSVEFFMNNSWQQPSFTPPTIPFVTTWTAGEGVSKTVTHNLGTEDVSIAIYDLGTKETIFVDSEVRTSTSVVTLTSSEAPSAAGWRVIVYAV